MYLLEGLKSYKHVNCFEDQTVYSDKAFVNKKYMFDCAKKCEFYFYIPQKCYDLQTYRPHAFLRAYFHSGMCIGAFCLWRRFLQYVSLSLRISRKKNLISLKKKEHLLQLFLIRSYEVNT